MEEESRIISVMEVMCSKYNLSQIFDLSYFCIVFILNDRFSDAISLIMKLFELLQFRLLQC
jgi:hypothetical protein